MLVCGDGRTIASDVLVASVSTYDELGSESAVKYTEGVSSSIVNSVEAAGKSADVGSDAACP